MNDHSLPAADRDVRGFLPRLRSAAVGMSLPLLPLALLAAVQQGTSFVPFEPRAYRLINSVAFSSDDSTMYFALLNREVLEHRDVPDAAAPETGIFSARRTAEGWTEPEILSFSGVFDDYEPTLTADDTLMVFNSRRPYPDGRTPERNDLWMVARDAEGWGTPARIDAISTFASEESYGTLTADRTLIFLRGRPAPSDEVSYDLYEARMIDGRFAAPTRHPVSTDRWGEGDPWVAPDGSYLIFTRWDESIGWTETVDLYIAFNNEGRWSTPVALDELNTDRADYGAAVSADGEWLYYRANSRFQRVLLAPVLQEYRSR